MTRKLGYVLGLVLVLVLSRAVNAQEQGSLRLVGGSSPNRGRLEVYISGQWGTVCDDSWGYSDALVACRQLGYTGVSSSDITISSGSSSQSIWLDDVGCSGSESKLINCHHNGYGVHDCSHLKDIGISCTGTSVRLAGGSTSYEGRVEVYYSGQWRSVCSTSSFFGADEATTVCRQLGYEYVSRTTRYYGSSSTTAYISCSGNQSSVDSCSIGSSFCSSFYRQYVVCREPSTSESNQFSTFNGDVRLVGGPTSGEGRVEVYYSGQWQAVCGYSYSFSDEAEVICRQLGYAAVSGIRSAYRSISGSSVSVSCSGGQNSLRECSLSSSSSYCYYNQPAVICSTSSVNAPLAWTILIPLVSGLVVLCVLCIPCCVAYRLYRKKSIVSSTRQTSDDPTIRYNVGSGSGEEARVDYPTLTPDQPGLPDGPSVHQEQLTGGPPFSTDQWIAGPPFSHSQEQLTSGPRSSQEQLTGGPPSSQDPEQSTGEPLSSQEQLTGGPPFNPEQLTGGPPFNPEQLTGGPPFNPEQLTVGYAQDTAHQFPTTRPLT